MVMMQCVSAEWVNAGLGWGTPCGSSGLVLLYDVLAVLGFRSEE